MITKKTKGLWWIWKPFRYNSEVSRSLLHKNIPASFRPVDPNLVMHLLHLVGVFFLGHVMYDFEDYLEGEITKSMVYWFTTFEEEPHNYTSKCNGMVISSLQDSSTCVRTIFLVILANEIRNILKVQNERLVLGVGGDRNCSTLHRMMKKDTWLCQKFSTFQLERETRWWKCWLSLNHVVLPLSEPVIIAPCELATHFFDLPTLYFGMGGFVLIVACFQDRRRFAGVFLVVIFGLPELYALLCHFKSSVHGCRPPFLVQWATEAKQHSRFTVLIFQVC